MTNGLIQRITKEESNSIQSVKYILTLKAPITIAADDSRIFFHCFSDRIRLDISCESSARQKSHMKHQALFTSKDKSKKYKSVVCCNFSWRFKG